MRLRRLALVSAGVVAAVAAVSAATLTANAAPPMFPPKPGCMPGMVFCEDFNALPLGAAKSTRWSVDAEKGSLDVSRTTVVNGWRRYRSQALRVRTTDNGRAFLVVKNAALGDGPVYGRMRLRVKEFPTAPNWAHFTLVEATGTGSKEIVRPVGGQFAPTTGGTYWGVGADGGPTGDWTNWKESAPVTNNRWQCVEFKLDPTGNQMQTWFDGVANPDLMANTTSHGGAAVPFVLPKIDTIKVGWQLYQPGTTPKGFDLLIDDLALSRTRVGC